MKALILLLASCTQLRVASVDEVVQPAFDVITSDLKALGYSDLVKMDRKGITIVNDDALVQARLDNPESKGIAYWDDENDRIVMPKPDTWYHYTKEDGTPGGNLKTQLGIELILAHEMGHAFGLPHTDHGIMGAHGEGDDECTRRAAACLVESLREKGMLR